MWCKTKDGPTIQECFESMISGKPVSFPIYIREGESLIPSKEKSGDLEVQITGILLEEVSGTNYKLRGTVAEDYSLNGIVWTEKGSCLGGDTQFTYSSSDQSGLIMLY